jgi:hypothetical protein
MWVFVWILLNPYWPALGAESRLCYPGNTADLSQSTASQNKRSSLCHHWGSILRLSARQCTSLTSDRSAKSHF